jgi:hypothetical protein
LAPGAEVTLSRQPQVDICFVFDTTGSMSNKIEGLIRCMTGFVDELANLSLDWRTTCVPFGDLTVPGDRVEAQLPFVGNTRQAKEQLRGMPRFSGGGNLGESSIDAMHAGLAKPWRPNAVRVVILLTDEPALQPANAGEIDVALDAANAICFVGATQDQYYKAWATNHGGRWVEIRPHMDTASIVKLLRSLVTDVGRVAHEVYAIAKGSVKDYLRLPVEKRKALGMGKP